MIWFASKRGQGAAQAPSTRQCKMYTDKAQKAASYMYNLQVHLILVPLLAP